MQNLTEIFKINDCQLFPSSIVEGIQIKLSDELASRVPKYHAVSLFPTLQYVAL